MRYWRNTLDAPFHHSADFHCILLVGMHLARVTRSAKNHAEPLCTYLFSTEVYSLEKHGRNIKTHALEADFLAAQDDQEDHVEMKQQEEFIPFPQSQDESTLKNATGVSSSSVHVGKLIENVRTLQNKASNRKLTQSVREAGFSGGFTNFVSTRKALILSAVLVLTYLVAGTIILAIWVKGDGDELPDWNAIDAFYCKY